MINRYPPTVCQFAVVHNYRRGCGFHHHLFRTHEGAEAWVSHLQKEGHAKIIAKHRLSKDCIGTFSNGTDASRQVTETLLVNGEILHAPITSAIDPETGNRLGRFEMTLAHAKERLGLYPWAADF